MIERFVFVKLKDSAYASALRIQALQSLGAVPTVRSVRVGTPADPAAEVWDLVFVLGFDSLEDVARYVDDPGHRQFVEVHLAPFAEVKKAWNFVTASD